MNKRYILSGVAALLATGAVAKPFSASDIPVDTKWVAYADMTKARDTQLGKHFINGIDEKDRRKLDAFKAIFNFDLINDIDSLMIFGPALEEDGDGVLLFSGNFNQEHLVTLLRANETYVSISHGEATIHSWVDDKNKGVTPEIRTYGAFASDGTIVIGDVRNLVSQALDVLEGKAAGLSGESALNLSDRGGAAVLAAALKVSDGESLPAEAAMLRQTRSMFVSVREKEGRLIGEIEINTDNSEAAVHMDSIVRGILAMGFLYEEAYPGLSELVRGVQIETKESRVLIKTSYPVEGVIKTIEASTDKAAHNGSADDAKTE